MLSVVRAVRAAVGPQSIVAVKLNSSDFQKGGFSHRDSIQVATVLQDEGVDFIEISGGNFEAPASYQHAPRSKSTVAREAYFLDYARDIKAALHIPIMVTGGFRSRDVMNRALASDGTDLIGMARPFVIDPAFPSKLLDGSIASAPAIERDFPPAEALPRGAVLNWFCDQLSRHGTLGRGDPAVSLAQGHERYLAQIGAATERLLAARASRP